MRSVIIYLAVIIISAALSTAAAAGSVEIGVSHDAQVVENYPTSNYGTNTSMYVASASGGTYGNERAWVKFDLAGHLPPGATITSAELRLYAWRADSSESMDTSVYGSTDDSWDEGTITWNSQPAAGTLTLCSTTPLNANDDNRWYAWDVTSFVTAEFGSDQLASFVVRAATEDANPYRSYSLDAKEYSSSLVPRLYIEYTGSWPTANGFKIFHMNDVHSRLLPHDFDLPGENDMPVFEQVGGAAYFTTKMLELKAANPNSLILDAGDISEGNPLGDLRGNGGMVDFYNLLDSKLKALGGRGIDAVVVGNHDVRSLEMVTNLKDNADFPAISVNVCNEGTHTPYFTPYVTVDVNGTKVGILGYTNDESSYLGTDTENVIDIVKCVWDDNDAATINIKDKVEELRTTENCDVVILLSHMGHSRITTGDDAVLADMGGVLPPEIVVCGHWHTWTNTVWQPAQLNYKTIITEAASYLQYIGELEVTGYGKYVQAQKHPIRNSDITADTDMETLIANLITEYQGTSPAHQLDDVIGYSAVDLTMDKDKWWTVSEYPWNATNAAGAWITDAMKWKAAQVGPAADMAFQSGGGIRRDIKKGWITYREIYEAYPWPDDAMVSITIPGSEVIDFIQQEHCGVSLSDGLMVTAEDGIISSVTLSGSPINTSSNYTVLISQYMYDHEYPWSDTTPTTVSSSIREAVVDYTSQFSDTNPMQVPGPRYNLDTELAGGFTAVVTMVADSEREPYYEDGFIRLISALPETTQRRGYYGLTDLVNSDGSINPNHPFAETMLYRSYLGFKDGLLKNGDIIEIWAEGGFYDGNTQLIEQEGIQSDGVEFKIVGNDPSLALPDYQPTVNGFMDEAHENRYVRFYAKKTGDSSVEDSEGTSLTIYFPGGYYTKHLPGNVGDMLEITGVQTQESATSRRFRCHTAVVATITGWAPTSSVDAITPDEQSSASITLTATASDVASGGSGTAVITPTHDAQVVEGYPANNYGTATYLYTQSANSGSYLNERAWMQFDLSSIPSGATITSATLKLYCWKAQGGDMSTSVHSAADDTWTESNITWNNQTTFGSALDTLTLINGQTSHWYSWDVTNFVQSEWGGDQTVSLVTKAVTESSSTTLTYSFDAKEYSGGSYAPQLEVQYITAATGGNVAGVEFFYRYAADGMNWSSWSSAGAADTAAPWEFSFNYPSGYGFYQFYSKATDDESNVEDAPVTADARVRYTSGSNTVPNPATNTSVPDDSYDEEVNQLLTVTVQDADNDFVDVCFYTGGGQLIQCVDNVGTGQSASAFWLNLDEDTSYDWYVVVDDGISSTQSEAWSFTTAGSSTTPTPVPAAGHVAIVSALTALLWMGYRRRFWLKDNSR